jgi:hypothetical protein
MNTRIAAVAVAAVTLLSLGAGVAKAPAAESLSCGVRVYVEGEYYGGTVLRSDHTSCPFAQNVVRSSLRFIIWSGGAGDGDFYTYAWSPVTLKNYRVHCFAHGDLNDYYGVHVDCRAGIGARVIYHARRLGY